MLILKRQDVEISTLQHPQSDQQIPILRYKGQTFRLLSAFKPSEEQQALALWRDLTDNQGKACILLQETERFSVWGKIRLSDSSKDLTSNTNFDPLIRASLLLLQAVYEDIEDFLGSRQAKLFQNEIAQVFRQKQLPQADSPKLVDNLLTIEPLTAVSVPPWQESHLITLLQELHRLGKGYLASSDFTHHALNSLEYMPEQQRAAFMQWLNQSTIGKLWE